MANFGWKFDLADVRRDILRGYKECYERGLQHTCKWLSEMNFELRHITPSKEEDTSNDVDAERDEYMIARSYFDLHEYDRCAFFTEKCKLPRNRFLHLYSRFLSGEKKRLDDTTDVMVVMDPKRISHLKELRAIFEKERAMETADGYQLYLFGVVLKKLDLNKHAMDVFLESIKKAPLMWGSWLELVGLIADRSMLNTLDLPDHWMKSFFFAQVYLDHQMNENAIRIYNGLQSVGFEQSSFLMAQTAIAYHNIREVDKAIGVFKKIRAKDPYRLDNLDTYSNLLYVKEMRVELSHLAHHVCQVDRYRVESACVIGNYYSLRSDHQKAVVYFHRALKLDPNYLAAWTLMGHEYMEMKNTYAAIQSYRQAVEVNRRDYRAWYGLGQTYEILKMPFYCLYYYKQAQALRPNDSRMLIALGEAFEKLDKIQDALKCYTKAHRVGDIEDMALLRLSKLFERMNMNDQAATSYEQYVFRTERQGPHELDEQGYAYKFLAHYYLSKGRIDEANCYAQKCLLYANVKEEGKTLLKTILQKRTDDSDVSMVVEEPSSQKDGEEESVQPESAPTNEIVMSP